MFFKLVKIAPMFTVTVMKRLALRTMSHLKEKLPMLYEDQTFPEILKLGCPNMPKPA